MDGNVDDDRTRLSEAQMQDQGTQSPFMKPPGSERRMSNASSVGVKRERNESSQQPNGDLREGVNDVVKEEQENKRPRLGGKSDPNGLEEMPPADPDGNHDLKQREETLRIQRGNKIEAEVADAVKDEDVKDEDIKNDHMKEEAPSSAPVKDEPVNGVSLKDESIKNESINEESEAEEGEVAE